MKSTSTLLLITLLLLACSSKQTKHPPTSENFTIELAALQEYFQIPGIAALIEQNGQVVYENYLGFSDLETQRKVDSTTIFPIASITKVFSGVLIMRLVEQGEISLEEPVNKYWPDLGIPDSISIKHLLSHTSQGEIGEQFYYSSRFGLLTGVLENATGKSLSELMDEEIFTPLNLTNTLLLKDSSQVSDLGLNLASPYILEDGPERGFVDFGYSVSAGITSTAKDLMMFDRALDANLLLKQESKNTMFSSFGEGLPYGYGIFSQEVQGMKIVWAYGQYDCYSSLFLKVPAKQITLILLANNNLMSDPPRLIYGDLTYSLFALSFLKNYVLDLPQMKLLEKPDSIPFDKSSNPDFFRKKVLAQALSASFMARFDMENMNTSSKLLDQVFSKYPNYLDYADKNLLHNLTFLKDVAFYRDLGKFDRFDHEIEAISQKLLQEAPNDPYLHVYLGTYYDRKGNLEQAKFHFENIINAENFSRSWYTMEASNWLEEYEKNKTAQ